MRSVAPIFVVAGAFLLTSCGGGDNTVGDALGINRRTPDEFSVVQRAPLVMPPNYSLRPPEPGAIRPQEGTTSQQARAILTGNDLDTSTVAATGGQSALLASAGASQADPDIRNTLLSEEEQLAGLDPNRFWIILDWQRTQYAKNTAAGTPVDARAEANRLAQSGISVRSTRVASRPIAFTGGS